MENLVHDENRFYSILVRLKEGTAMNNNDFYGKFLFHTGSIKSVGEGHF